MTASDHHIRRLVWLPLLLWIAGIASAQPTVWKHARSPSKVTISGYSNITYFRDSILATQGSNLLLSTDRGDSWTKVSAVPYIDWLAVVSDELFIRVPSSAGILRSLDRGKTLTVLDSGLHGSSVRQLTVVDTFLVGIYSAGRIARIGLHSTVWELLPGPDPANRPNNLFGTGTVLLCEMQQKVYRSTDDGLTWALTNLPDAGYSLFAAQREVLYAAVRYTSKDDGLWRSDDGGSSWKLITTRLNTVQRITQLAGDGTTLIALSDSLYTSADTGLSIMGHSFWPTLPTDHFEQVFVHEPLWIANFTGNGTFRSTDHGTVWKQLGTVVETAEPIDYIYAMASRSDTLLAAPFTPAGVFLSRNGATDWTYMGQRTQQIRSLLVADGQIVAGTTNSCYHLDAASGSWGTSAGIGGNVYTLTEFDGSVYAGVDSGVRRSDDGCRTFVDAGTGLAGTQRYAVYSFATIGSNLFAGAFDLFGSYGGVFLTTNHGTSWTNVGLPHVSIYSLLASGNILFAATVDSGIYRSLDLGKTWKSLGMLHQYFTGLAEGFGKIFASTLDTGVFVTTDLGDTWWPYDSGLSTLHIERLHRFGDTLFASTYEDGLYLLRISQVESVRADEQTESAHVIVMPNPARSSIRIAADAARDESISVYDALGRRVFFSPIASLPTIDGNVVLNIAQLPIGFYRVEVRGARVRYGSFEVIR